MPPRVLKSGIRVSSTRPAGRPDLQYGTTNSGDGRSRCEPMNQVNVFLWSRKNRIRRRAWRRSQWHAFGASNGHRARVEENLHYRGRRCRRRARDASARNAGSPPLHSRARFLGKPKPVQRNVSSKEATPRSRGLSVSFLSRCVSCQWRPYPGPRLRERRQARW